MNLTHTAVLQKPDTFLFTTQKSQNNSKYGCWFLQLIFFLTPRVFVNIPSMPRSCNDEIAKAVTASFCKVTWIVTGWTIHIRPWVKSLVPWWASKTAGKWMVGGSSPQNIVEGSFEIKLPTIWTDEKQRWEGSEKRRKEEKAIKKQKSQKKEDPGAWKGRKVAKHCVFPLICGSGGSKSRLAKELAGQMRDEKLHAGVARSTFPSQNVQSTPCSDHFWKLWCRKSAQRCGTKHISRSKCIKTLSTCSHRFWMFRRALAWQAQGIVDLVKSEKNVRVCSSSKNDGRRGAFEEDLAR